MSEYFSPGVSGWNGRIMRKRKAQGLYHTGHGGSRSHDSTMTLASAHTGFRLSHLILAHFALSIEFTKPPDITCPDIVTPVLPRKHRSARYHYGWNINTGGAH